jgi:hypothetical protein
VHGLGLYFKQADKVRHRAGVILAGKAKAMIHVQVGECEGKPSINWYREEDAIAAASSSDGIYSLATKLPEQAERGRFAPDLKGAILGRVTSPRPQGPPPHAAHLSPNDGRIEALVSIVGLALLIFGLIEIDLRDQLGSHQAMPGLLPDGRSARPTGRNIFSAFQSLGLTYTSHGIRLDRLTATQRRILSLLRIPFPGWSNTPSPDPSHCVRKTGLTARFHGSNPCSGARIRTWWG